MSTQASHTVFAAKRKHWLYVLASQDQHSIIRQLTQMAWNMAAFQVVNNARGLAPPDPGGGVQLNGLMHRLLDRGFFISQMAAIRRLMGTAYPLEGKSGEYSLAKLLNPDFPDSSGASETDLIV